VLISTVVASCFILGASAAVVASDARSAALFYSNFHFSHSLTSYLNRGTSTSPVLNFWSLSIEEQFYFVWPSVLVILLGAFSWSRRRVATRGPQVFLGLAIVASMSLSYFMTSQNQVGAFYSSFIRAGELALGALLAFSTVEFAKIPERFASALSWIGLLGILLVVHTYNDDTVFPGLAVLLPILATALVILASPTLRQGSAELVLGCKPALVIGALSYSIYLWHWPIYQLTVDEVGHVPSASSRFLMLCVVAVISSVCYYAYEHPVRRNKWLRQRPRFSLGVGGVCLLVTLLTTFLAPSLLAAQSTPWDGKVTVIHTQMQLHAQLADSLRTSGMPRTVVPLSDIASEWPDDRGCLVSYSVTSPAAGRPSNAVCTWGDTRARRAMALLGDSHILMWLPALSAIGMRDGFRVVLFARGACYISNLPLLDYSTNAPGVGCTKFQRAWVVPAITAIHPFAIVMADATNDSPLNYQGQKIPLHTYADGIAAQIRSLPRTATKVVLGSEPVPTQDPVTCLEVHSADVQSCTMSWSQATSNESRRALLLASHIGGAHYFAVNSWFCVRNGCPEIADHTLIYYNQYHITKHYSLLLQSLLAQRLARVGIR
jgi:peptidoglycan/LPS O-acetylase OafA/YrhL